MIIFQKPNHLDSSTKRIIFRPILLSIFWTRFQTPPKSTFVLTVTHHLSTLSMLPKTKKGAAAKPLLPTSADSAPKRARKPSSKVAQSGPIDFSDEEEDATSQLQPAKVRRLMRISWTTARTERLLDWLEENPVDRQKLFSDSTKDAKDEGRRKRVAKGTKSEFHKLIAIYVFSVDVDKEVRMILLRMLLTT